MLDILWIVLGVILILVGVIGCFLPIVPGPTLAYIGLLVTQLKESPPYTSKFLFLWALVIVGTVLLDYLLTPMATKQFGGSQKGVIGSTVGLILGIFFFPPLGFIIGPLLGAYLGEIIDGKTTRASMKAALGALVGLITGSLLKLVVVVIIGYYFIQSNF